MHASIEEGFLVMKTTAIAALIGLTMAIIAPAFGVTEPLPSLREAEAAALALSEKNLAKGEKVSVWGRFAGWSGTKMAAVSTAKDRAMQAIFDPEAVNVAVKAENKVLRLRVQQLIKDAVDKKVGSDIEVDTLKGCVVSLQVFLEKLKPE